MMVTDEMSFEFCIVSIGKQILQCRFYYKKHYNLCRANIIQEIMQIQKTKSLFNPRDYIIKPQLLQQYQCIICMQKSINMLRCKSCHKFFCNQCTIDQKSKFKICPQRCTQSQFTLESIPQLKIEYKCPFSSDCQKILHNIQQFANHDRQCHYITQKQIAEQNKKWQFKCDNGHTLQIKIDIYKKLIERQMCSKCGEQALIRIICRKCDTRYCKSCRPIPIYEMKCPIGHQFIKRDAHTICYRCDICELSPMVTGTTDIYDDFTCNVGICQKCFKMLPQFKKPVHYVENLYNACDLPGNISSLSKMNPQQLEIYRQLHKLTIVPLTLQKCRWCEKTKVCYKKCIQCNKYYCMECKKFEVKQNLQCQFGHQIYQIIGNQQHQQIQQNQIQQEKIKKCSKCNQTSQNKTKVFFRDDECNLQFCYPCLEYLVQYNFDSAFKNLSLQVKHCYFGNHPLFFMPAKTNKKRVCSNCAQQKIIKFFCGLCKDGRLYCCQCIPAPDCKKCYCKANLMLVEESTTHEMCLACGDKVEKAYQCRPCCYTICQMCYQNGLNVKPIQKQAKLMIQIE